MTPEPTPAPPPSPASSSLPPLPANEAAYADVREVIKAADTTLAGALFRIAASYPPALRPQGKRRAQVWDVCTPEELTFLRLLGDAGQMIDNAHQYVAGRLDVTYQELAEPDPTATRETLSARLGRAIALVKEAGYLAVEAMGAAPSNEAAQAHARFAVAWTDLAFLQERADTLEVTLVGRETANAAALAALDSPSAEAPADGH